jgi:outer membrane receptor protein involved in Fe transport
MVGNVDEHCGSKKLFLVCQIVLTILLVFNSILLSGITGKISGRITDKSTGESMIGANVILVGTRLGASTDNDGFFTIINVPPGTYKLSVRYIGYATVTVEDVRVSLDRTTKQDVALTPEAVEGEEVVVVAERPVIEMDRTHSSAIVNSSTVELMPVTEVYEVIALQAGVVESNGALHFRGGRAREVAYIIDGVPVTNSYYQGGGKNVTVENSMIEELEVISGTFNAEYGSAQSGIVNIVTKRPAKKFTGSLRAYSGEWLSNKSDVFLGIDDFNPLAEKNIQFSLSGPLVSDKLGFFVTGRYNNSESMSWYERRFTPNDGWRIAAYQRWYQDHFSDQYDQSQAIYIPDSLRTGDLSRGPLRTGYRTSLSAKLVYYANPTLSFNYQTFGSFGEYEGSTSSAYRYQPDQRGTSRGWDNSHFFAVRHSPTENFFYNLAFSYQFEDGESFYRKDNKIALYPGDEGIQLISASADGFSLGSTDGFYNGKDGKDYIELYLAKGDFSWQVNKYNFVKAGFEVKKHSINNYSRGYKSTQEWRNYSFPSRQDLNGADVEFNDYWDYLQEYWRNWEDIFDTTRYVKLSDEDYALWHDYDISPLEAAVYMQNKLEVGRIIVNAGLRFDLFKPNEKFPKILRTEAENLGSLSNLKATPLKYQLSPRLGVSFPISSNGAFHASYGHFFQMPSFQYMYNEPLRTLTRIQLEGRTLGNADLGAEKTIAYEIGLQQGITENIAIDITAYYKDFRNLLGVEYVTTLDAVGFQRFVNRDYGNTKGITVGISKGGRGLITGGANYTLAFANGSSSDPTSIQLIQTATRVGGEPVQFVDRQILSLNWDQTHTLNVYVNLAKRNNWSVGLVSYVNSGTPFSPTFVERYDLSTREYKNYAKKPFRWSVDLKARKYLKLAGINTQLFIKVDNIFDHLNHNSVFSSTGRADQIARLPEMKQLELERLSQEGLFTLDEIDLAPGYFSNPRKIQMGLEFIF